MAVTASESQRQSSPAVKRPPPYHRSFTAFGANIDFRTQVQMAPWPACQILFVGGTGVLQFEGEDGVAFLVGVDAAVGVVGPLPGGFRRLLAAGTTVASGTLTVSWAAAAG